MQKDEKIFFDERGVKVTNTRFILPNDKTFAMSGVTAVRTSRVDPAKNIPIIMMIVGGIVAYAHGGLNGWSILLLVVGALWLWLQKPTFFVTLSTASGEQQALEDKSSAWISSVVAALNESIIYRG